MAGQKKVIKASAAETMGAKVEKVDFGIRKFGNKVFKDVRVSEEPVELEKTELPAEDVPPEQEAQSGQDEEKKEVELEKSYDDDGNLAGLVIRCRCGEVIELEFTRD